MEQVQMNIEKVNIENFLNKEVEDFKSRWSQSLVNENSPSYLKQKNFEYYL